MAKSKSTKKFEKNKLPKVLEQRNAVKKIKQRQRTAKKRKTEDKEYYNDEQASGDEEDEEKKAAAEKAKKAKGKNGVSATDGGVFDEMSVEQFFQGGFEVPEETLLKKRKKDGKSGKRKRDEMEEAVEGGSDEGEDEEAEGEDVVGSHKDQLAALAEKDPEFFKYLQENDSELLDFTMAENDDLSGVSDLDDGEEDEDDEPSSKKSKKEKKAEKERAKVVKKDQLERWATSLKDQKSLRATREVVLAFRAAAHVGDADAKKYKYSIANPDVYHELLVLALKEIPEVLNHHLPVKELPNGKVRLSTDSPKFQTLTPLLKSHSASLLHLLGNITDSPTIKLILNSTHSLLPYLLTHRHFIRAFTKQVTEIWSSPTTTDPCRITAYLTLRRLLTISPSAPIRTAILKQAYNALLKGFKTTTVHTLPSINLIKNGAVDLFTVDVDTSYVLGFSYIRQLAVLLRTSITNTSKESYKTVYNWQYVHSLDFWSRVLATHCDGLKTAERGKESPLQPLIYPLVQVTLGAARLIPTAQYFPLRLHLIRSLIRLSRHTGVYIPLASVVIEMLSSNELTKSGKGSTQRPLDWETIIRVPSGYLKTRVLQDGLGEQIVEVLGEYMVLWANSIAFPELSVPVVVVGRKWVKKASGDGGNKNARVNNSFATLISKLEANAKWIEEKRRDVHFGPGRLDEVMGFAKRLEWEKSPLGLYVLGLRKVREEKRKILEEAKKAEEEKERKDKEKKEKKERKLNGTGNKAKVVEVEEESDDEEFDDDSEDSEELQFESDDED